MIWFGLVLWHINHCRLFNDKSSFYIYIYIYIYIYWIYMIWFGLALWHINHCRLFNDKSSFYIYIYIYIYIYWIYMIWFGLVLWHINHCRLFNAKSFLYIYIEYMICKHILQITFLIEPELFFFCTQLKGFKHFCLTLIIHFYYQSFDCTHLNGYTYDL